MKTPNYIRSDISFGECCNMLRKTRGEIHVHGPDSASSDVRQLATHRRLRDYIVFSVNGDGQPYYIMHKRGNWPIAKIETSYFDSILTLRSPYINKSRVDKHVGGYDAVSSRKLDHIVAIILTLPIGTDEQARDALVEKLTSCKEITPRRGSTKHVFGAMYSESKNFASDVAPLIGELLEELDVADSHEAAVRWAIRHKESLQEKLNAVGYLDSVAAHRRRLERDERLEGKQRVLMFKPPRFANTDIVVVENLGRVEQAEGGEQLVYIDTTKQPGRIPQEVQAIFASLAVSGNADSVGVVEKWSSANTTPDAAIMFVSDAAVETLFGEANIHGNT